MTEPKLMAKGHIQLEDLIRRFPNGFVISPKLGIYEIVGTAVNEVTELPVRRARGSRIRGYIAVSLPEVKPGDELFGESYEYEDIQQELNAVEELAKHANRRLEDEVTEALYEDVSDKLNNSA